MTESEAIVTRLDGDHAWVDIATDCASCGDKAGCGLGERKGRRLQRVRNLIGARVGDMVVLAVPDGTVLRAAFYCYLLPLVLALGGAAVGAELGGELGAALGAVVGLLAGWSALRWGDRREPALALRLKDAVVHLQRNLEK